MIALASNIQVTIRLPDGTDCHIRSARPKDARGVISAIDTVAAEGIFLATDCYVPTPTWERIIYRPSDAPLDLLLIAEINDRVIAWCRLFRSEFGNKSFHVAEIGYGILKAYRGYGIGTELIQQTLLWAQSQGYCKLIISVFSNNIRSLQVLKKLGFLITGVRNQQYRVGNDYVDEILMERFL
jgi:RimJ/RimL family protein N-acetyltransferase